MPEVEVAIPSRAITLPCSSTMNTVVVAEMLEVEIATRGVVATESPAMERRAKGEVVAPIPTLTPFVLTPKSVSAPKRAVEEAEKRPENTFLLVNVLLSARSVELAAVMVPEPPSEIEVPFTVSEELASLAFAIAPFEIEKAPVPES
jgi:hypothetical protein